MGPGFGDIKMEPLRYTKYGLSVTVNLKKIEPQFKT